MLTAAAQGRPWRERQGVRWAVLALAIVGALTVVAVVVGVIAFLLTSRPDDDALAPVAPTATLEPVVPEADPAPEPTEPAPTTGPAPAEPEPLPTPPEDIAAGETWLPDIDVRTAQLRRDDVDLRDVHLVARGARLASDGTIRAQQMNLDALVPFATAESQVGNGIRLTPTDDGLVRATLPLSFFGRTLDLAVEASVQAEGDGIAFQPVRTPGQEGDGGAVGGLLERVGAFRQEVPDLPEGASIDDVAVTQDGFQVRASGQDVVLRPGD